MAAETLARRARMLDRGRVDSLAAQRETTRLLVIVLALSPYTRATDAPPGQPGRPIEPIPPHLQKAIPRQRSAPPRGLCSPFHHRRLS